MYNVCYFLEGKFSRDTAHVFRTIQRRNIWFPCEVKTMMITKLIKYYYIKVMYMYNITLSPRVTYRLVMLLWILILTGYIPVQYTT